MSADRTPAKRTPLRPTLELGDAIREGRQRRDLSMQATASQAGISAGYQFKLEGGFVRTPSPRVLHRLSGVLDLSYPNLMKVAGYPPETDSTPSSIRVGPSEKRGSGAQQADGEAMSEPAPSNRRIVRLLEEIRRDVAALREDVRRLSAPESAHLPKTATPTRDQGPA
jgi:transcriptional regulator with XRE-family HTH domain